LRLRARVCEFECVCLYVTKKHNTKRKAEAAEIQKMCARQKKQQQQQKQMM